MRRRFSFSRRSILVAFFSLCLLVIPLAMTVDFDAIRSSFRNADHLSKLKRSSSSSFDEVENFLKNEKLKSFSAEESAEILWAPFDIEFLNLNRTYTMVVPRRDDDDGDEASDDAVARNVCGARLNSTKLLVLVPTRPDAFERRARMRKSWAERNLTSSLGIVVRFVMGKSQDPTLSALLIDELRTLNDLIINDIPDAYGNLYLKVYSALQWQQAYCPGVEYVLKTDDDTVVDLERLAFWLEEEFAAVVRKHPLAVFGGSLCGTHPIRNSTHKWYVAEEDFPGDTFPNYVTGATYLLTARAVEAILSVAPQFNSFSIEDALFTGVLAGGAGVYKYDASKFFRNGLNKTDIYEWELCDYRNEPFVLSLYDFPDELFLARYKEMRNAKCWPTGSLLHKLVTGADLTLFRKI